MNPHRLSRLALAVLAVLAVGGAAISNAGAPKKITRAGVDGVKLGKTHKKLCQQGLVGKLRRGCPLGGPRTRAARLRRPLRGSVNYTQRRPRRVVDITITGGATARGVGIGDRIRDIRAAYSKVRVNRTTEEVFGLTLVNIPRKAGGKLNFGVDVNTKKITLIGVPHIAFCE